LDARIERTSHALEHRFVHTHTLLCHPLKIVLHVDVVAFRYALGDDGFLLVQERSGRIFFEDAPKGISNAADIKGGAYSGSAAAGARRRPIRSCTSSSGG
jgi:hypothetical protein